MAAAIQFSQLEHRGRLPRAGGLLEQAAPARFVSLDAFAIEQQHRQAQLGGGIALSGGALEPLERPRVLASFAVAAGVQHAQAELPGGLAFFGGGREPVLGRLQVLHHAEAGCALVAQARLGGAIAAAGRRRVPDRGLFRVLAHGQPLREEAIEHGVLGGALRRFLLRMISGTLRAERFDPGDRRGRGGGRRLESGEIDLSQARLRGQAALLGGGAEPPHRVHEALQYPLTSLVQLPQSQLRIDVAGFGQFPKHRRRFDVALIGERALRTLERARLFAPLQPGKDAHRMRPAYCGSRIASEPVRRPPSTRYERIVRRPTRMSPASVMPGISRKSAGTSRRRALLIVTATLK